MTDKGKPGSQGKKKQNAYVYSVIRAKLMTRPRIQLVLKITRVAQG